jgi:hypothetical protein
MQLQNGTVMSSTPLESRLFVVGAGRAVSIAQLNADVQVSPHLMNLKDDGRLIRMTNATATTFTLAMSAVAQKFYEYGVDGYDFLSVFAAVGTTGGTKFSCGCAQRRSRHRQKHF